MRRQNKYVYVTIPGVQHELPLEKSGTAVQVSVEWLRAVLDSTTRPEDYREMDVVIPLTVKDLQLLFGEVEVHTRIVERSDV